MRWYEIKFPFQTRSTYYCNTDGKIMSRSKYGIKRNVKGNKLKSGLSIEVCPQPYYGKKKTFTVAQIVLKTFRKQPPGKQAHHINGNVLDNRIDNLTWRSKSEIASKNSKAGRINKINSLTRYKPTKK